MRFLCIETYTMIVKSLEENKDHFRPKEKMNNYSALK